MVHPDVGRHEWRRSWAAWHALFAVVSALTTVLVWLDDTLDGRSRGAALLLIAVLAAAYALAGSAALARRDRVRAVVYLAVAVPVCLAAMAVSPVVLFLFVLLYPQVWAMLPARPAFGVTVLMVVAVTLISMARDGFAAESVAGWLLVAAVSLLIAAALGAWITRVIRQSRQRAALVADLAATRAELAAVSRDAGALAERERLARDIHDTLAQGYTSILLLLDAAETTVDTDPARSRELIVRARDTARHDLAEARALVAALTPPDLSRTSLPEALRRVVVRAGSAQVDDGTGGCRLTVTGQPRGLPVDHEVTLVRAAQEALANARRHAGTGRAAVALSYQDGAVTLAVTDTGRGFDQTTVDEGYGLGGLRSRVARLGGTVEVVSAPGAGTTVTVRLPVGSGPVRPGRTEEAG